MKTNITKMFLILLLTPIYPSYLYAGQIYLLAGDEDNFFSASDPQDLTTQRAGFDDVLKFEPNNDFYFGGTPRHFDVQDINHTFGYTFENLAVIDANFSVTLEIGLKAGSTVSNDGIYLLYHGAFSTGQTAVSGNDFFWTSGLNGLNGLTDPWTNSAGTLVLDLASLPTASSSMNLISDINAVGYLDIYIQDDTAVDYIKLNYTSVPEPHIFSLMLMGIFSIVFINKRKIVTCKRK